MYMEDVNFWEGLENITNPEVKSHAFKYHKYLNQSTLHFIKLIFDVDEKVQRENMEREARQ